MKYKEKIELDVICPKCGNKTFVKEVKIRVIPNSYYEEYHETIKCEKCGHIVYDYSGEILAI